MSDIADSVSQLAELWPALAQALARDAADGDGPSTHGWTAAAVVNADVLAAMITLGRHVPAVTRSACKTVREPWQRRSLQGCLRQIPRLAGRMHDLGLAEAEVQLTDDVSSWLRTTKLALGLRKPDVPIGYACPWAASQPENHAGGVRLIRAGDEGFLHEGPDGTQVRWVSLAQIYCAGCGASWGAGQWPRLARLVRNAAIQRSAS